MVPPVTDPPVKVVKIAVAAFKSVAKKLEEVALVSVLEEDVRSVMVALVIVVVASVEVPVAVKSPVVRVVKEGVDEILIVEVEERRTLDPAVK